jgi:CheY-like chemotaxis protein
MFSPKKVLVIDDNADSREILEIILSQRGYGVITAEDGIDGQNKAETESPDVIISDLHMPGLHGLEMIQKLRQIPRLSRTPIVVLTADRDAKKTAVEAGADSILIKPFSLEDMIRTIAQLLESR